MEELKEKIRLGIACCLPDTDEDAALGCAKCPYNDGHCGDADQDVSIRLAIIEDVRRLVGMTAGVDDLKKQHPQPPPRQ